MKKGISLVCRVAAAAALAGIVACGGGGSGPSAPTPTPTPVPTVTITATGEGALVLHPSLDPRLFYALETPIRITETAGGTANWNFARISFFMGATEIERYELGANDIAAAGFSRIAARSNDLYAVIFRNNSDTFDRVDITLGFSDLKDGRQFNVMVPFGSFSGVNLSLTPLSVPGRGTVVLARR
jgi:hypothetical protein